MKAFIEDICEHAGIIRVGPDTDTYGKPFDVAVAFKVEYDLDGSRVATIKALTARLVPLTAGHTRAALRVLAERGLKARWFRSMNGGRFEREVRPFDSQAPLGRVPEPAELIVNLGRDFVTEQSGKPSWELYPLGSRPPVPC